MMRIVKHPILGDLEDQKQVTIIVDGKAYPSYEGEMIAAALTNNNIKTFRYTKHLHKPRGIYCGIGRCTDCVMIVDGIPNVRTCVTPVKDKMNIETQYGVGQWTGGAKNE
ncbi:MAG TPA: (2Fe-2S)-binding protein [Anaerovoracaceae bacterium]|nr:(2Fe-2S)-binding protein [Anaerovoracaceae bacterium]